MEKRELGRGGPRVSVVGMGTWQTLDVPEGRDDVVAAALDAGSTFVDSSPMYGEAERTLAQGLGARRAEAFVATKLWTPDDREARRQAERALHWYGGLVDLYQVHNLVGTTRGSTCSRSSSARARSAGSARPTTARRRSPTSRP